MDENRTAAKAHGVDAPPERRPGVPREAPPKPVDGAGGGEPERQDVDAPHLRRAGLERLTPVVGTAQPPRGASGFLRRRAYRVPEHRARHWALLLLADRVDVLEDRLGTLIGSGLRRVGFEGVAERARRNPLPATAVTALAGWLLLRRLSRPSRTEDAVA